jgi:hypothetical protein
MLRTVPSAGAGPSVNVVVASGDGSFRRLAGAALSRAGHDVRTIAARPWRVRRLIDLGWPDVVVVEQDGEFADELSEHVEGLADRPGVVLVAEKWRPVDTLVGDVERAAAERRSPPPRPNLRVVDGGP